MVRRKLTPKQRDILWMLREAHEEDLSTILNTLKPEPGAGGLAEVDTALRGLLSVGLVDIGHFREVPRSFSPVNHHILGDVLAANDGPFEWQEEDEIWVWHGGLFGMEDELTVVLTEAGETALNE